MNHLLRWPRRQITLCLLLLTAFPLSEAFAEPTIVAQTTNGRSDSSSLRSLDIPSYPDSPGTLQPPAAQQTQTSKPQQQATPPAPIGTAAAPDEQPAGVAASKPSGAAIAPAKQKRIRTYAVRTALVVGAAVAIGVVVGASLGSPARAQ